MRYVIESLAEFDALPEKHRQYLMEIIQFDTLVAGIDVSEHPEFSVVCLDMLKRINSHPEIEELAKYEMFPAIETELRVRMLKDYAKGFLQ
jgi:hypothetical protein